MFKRFLLVLITLGMVAACSHKDGEGVDSTSGPGGTAGYGGVNSGPVNPGTEEDLVANVGDRVFFNYDSAVLSSEAQSTLAKQAEWLKKYSDIKITIEGHCDERGTREYNLALGERRAAAVKNYLVSMGVPKDRISTISYGKEHPEVLGSDEEAWSKNRRGVTVVSR